MRIECITDEQDKLVRQYAKRLDAQLGEDAYHNAICYFLEHPKPNEQIREFVSLMAYRTRMCLYKIFRHEQVERKNIEHYINGDPIPAQRGLTHGWGVKLLKCRKGLHDMVEENLTYVGTRRTCLACMRERLKRKRQR